jgi:hypothetical protein
MKNKHCFLMTDSTTLTFNGSQHMLITMPDEFHTQAEDVTLRFRTTRPLGLLLTTNTEQSADRLELALMGGRVRLVARLGDREKVGQHPQPCLSDFWDTRYGNNASGQYNDIAVGGYCWTTWVRHFYLFLQPHEDHLASYPATTVNSVSSRKAIVTPILSEV